MSREHRPAAGSGGGRRFPRRPAPGALLGPLLLVLLVPGCAPSVDPIERLGRKAVHGVGPEADPPARPAGPQAAVGPG